MNVRKAINENHEVAKCGKMEKKNLTNDWYKNIITFKQADMPFSVHLFVQFSIHLKEKEVLSRNALFIPLPPPMKEREGEKKKILPLDIFVSIQQYLQMWGPIFFVKGNKGCWWVEWEKNINRSPPIGRIGILSCNHYLILIGIPPWMWWTLHVKVF